MSGWFIINIVVGLVFGGLFNGDSKKYRDNIALFPMKPAGTYDSTYKGTEYMSIYPYISYFDGTEKYTDGSQIKQGYYVRTISKDGNYITPLAEWFKR